MDSRELTPGMVERVVYAAAETRSFARASLALEKLGGEGVSAATVQRVVGEVGGELASRPDAEIALGGGRQRPETPPELAVVECDGGRVRTREPGHGRGVHLCGEGWRETKNACLIRGLRGTFAEDPQPEPPACFCDPQQVAEIAAGEAFSAAAPRGVGMAEAEGGLPCLEAAREVKGEQDWRPRRLVRTVVSSIQSSRDFGRQMAQEAKRRGFFEASARVFLGDGLGWNWTIWKQHFPSFTPVLDFIHPLSYLFLAAKSVYPDSAADAWHQYLAWMRGCWQGEVEQVLEELRVWQNKLGEPPKEALETDPRKIVAATVRYLENNRSRMDYPSYRGAGLPVTTAWMESLVKEMNYRVKGTEMFWNDPEGVEAILQVRAAALSDDDRLSKYLRHRPGCPFIRRPKSSKLSKSPAKTCKS